MVIPLLKTIITDVFFKKLLKKLNSRFQVEKKEKEIIALGHRLIKIMQSEKQRKRNKEK